MAILWRVNDDQLKVVFWINPPFINLKNKQTKNKTDKKQQQKTTTKTFWIRACRKRQIDFQWFKVQLDIW